MTNGRIERDALGEVIVPAGAYYGAQTQRAVQNFQVSGERFPVVFTRTLGAIKWAAARTNQELGLLSREIGQAIQQAAREVMEGRWDDQFVIDVFQTGSGTSTNMNTNEVIASRANEILGGKPGDKAPVHPNDHVNRGQSSNDVIPTGIQLAAVRLFHTELFPGLERLHRALAAKAEEYADIVKLGRTHLMDATPVTLGQVFGGYAMQVKKGIERARMTLPALLEVPLGGTAVGTGINTHEEFAERTLRTLSEELGFEITPAVDRFEAQGARDAVVEASGALKTVAVSLAKIANDLRLLASGPYGGLGEIRLPSIQPGSSIMPGKVNPVIPEMVMQVSAQVLGNDVAINIGGQGGQFELNAMLPLMGQNLFQSILLLGRAAGHLAEKCVEGIEADAERCRELVEKSLSLVTSLAPRIGYDLASVIVKEALASERTLREVATERSGLSLEELEEALDPLAMTKPGIR